MHIADLEDEQHEVKILDYLQQIIDFMSAAPKMLKIVGNFDQLEQEFKSGSDWNFLLENPSIENQRYDAVTNQTWNNIGSIRAIINSSQEGAYLIRKSRIIDCGWNSDKTAALMIIAKYLEIESGPLWENCREAGYCYSVSLTANIDAGTLTLELSDCSDLKKTFNAARQTMPAAQKKELFIDILINLFLDITINRSIFSELPDISYISLNPPLSISIHPNSMMKFNNFFICRLKQRGAYTFLTQCIRDCEHKDTIYWCCKEKRTKEKCGGSV
uniref:Uncharacterized protein n=1 Tax=Meloidogyne incognita TaxID=6306 RepID=A0A914LF87_MELIC